MADTETALPDLESGEGPQGSRPGSSKSTEVNQVFKCNAFFMLNYYSF